MDNVILEMPARDGSCAPLVSSGCGIVSAHHLQVSDSDSELLGSST